MQKCTTRLLGLLVHATALSLSSFFYETICDILHRLAGIMASPDVDYTKWAMSHVAQLGFEHGNLQFCQLDRPRHSLLLLFGLEKKGLDPILRKGRRSTLGLVQAGLQDAL
jgi:hypothetical protein